MEYQLPTNLEPIFSHLPKQIHEEFFIQSKLKVLELVADIRTRRRLTKDDYDSLYFFHGLNSYEREIIGGNLDDAAFELLVEKFQENCSPRYHSSYRPCSTYDEAMVHFFAPLMLKRIRELAAENEELRKRAIPAFIGG